MGEAGRAGIYQAAIKAAGNYAFGKGTPRDMVKANEMLDLSKKLSRRVWTIFAHNLVEEKRLDDFAQADVEDEISTAADKAQRQIQFEIAGSFADPKSKDYDAREAAKWYELAADGGDMLAMLNLASIYSEGRLGQPDPVKAFNWFKQAAEKGNHTLGWANLAICYQNGIGTPKDPAKAAKVFKENRDDDIVCYLGSIGRCPTSVLTYEQELGLNIAEAKKAKDPQAQYILGQRYLKGWGVKADLDDAAALFKKAARLEFQGLFTHWDCFTKLIRDPAGLRFSGRMLRQSRGILPKGRRCGRRECNDRAGVLLRREDTASRWMRRKPLLCMNNACRKPPTTNGHKTIWGPSTSTGGTSAGTGAARQRHGRIENQDAVSLP